MKNMVGHEKLCTLVLDEVQICQAIQYDPGLKQFVGHIDEAFQPKFSTEAACHVLCYMAKGITLHWKQIVGALYIFLCAFFELLYACLFCFAVCVCAYSSLS